MEARLGSRAGDPFTVRELKSGFSVTVTRVGAGANAESRKSGRMLVYAEAFAGADSYVLAEAGTLEELIQLRTPTTLAYDVALPSGARLHAVDGTSLEIRDGAGIARLRVTASQAWGRSGQRVAVGLRVASATRIQLTVPDDAPLPMLIDPTWTATSSMATGRSDQTATVLAGGTGKVLIVGGRNAGAALASAEIFDPQTNTFTSAGTLNIARYSHSAVLLDNGQVLIAGGRDTSGNALASAEIFDPQSVSFALTPQPMLVARFNHTCTDVPPGLGVFCIGGQNASGAVTAVDRFVSGAWQMSAPLPTPRSQHTATLFGTSLPGSKILVVGGRDGSGTPLSSALIFDAASATWASAGTFGTARAGHSATWYNTAALSRVVVVGGFDGSLNPVPNVDEFNPASNTWSTAAAMTWAVNGHAAVLLASGRILVVPGDGAQGCQSACQPSGVAMCPGSLPPCSVAPPPGVIGRALSFDTAANSWADEGLLTAARDHHTATLLPNGKVLVAGGTGTSGTDLASAEIYDPTNGTINPTATGSLIGGTRSQATATPFTSGSSFGVLIAGGSSSPGTSEQFFEGSTFGNSSSLNFPRLAHTATLLYDGTVLAAGGVDGSGTLVTRGETWNSATNAWTAAGSMVQPRALHTATLLPSGKVLVAGGEPSNTGVGGFSGPTTVFGTAELYDPQTRTFAATGNMVTPRAMHSASLLPDGRVLIAGGYVISTCPNCGLPTDSRCMVANPTCPPPPVCPMPPCPPCPMCGSAMGCPPQPPCNPSAVPGTESEIYDPASGTFTATSPMQFPHSGHTATGLLGGRVAVIGGDALACIPCMNSNTLAPYLTQCGPFPPLGGGGPFCQSVPQTNIEIFDPQATTWTHAGSLLIPRDQHTATMLPWNRILVAHGGTLNCSPPMGCWPGPPCPPNALPPCTAVTYGGPLASLEIFDPAARTSTGTGFGAVAREDHVASILSSGRVVLAGGGSATGELYDLGIDTGVLPRIQVQGAGAPTSASAGGFQSMTIFPQYGLQGSGGSGTQNSPFGYPMIVTLQLDSGGLGLGNSLIGPLAGQLSWNVPLQTLSGPSLVWVTEDDVLSGTSSSAGGFVIEMCPQGKVFCGGRCVPGNCCAAVDCNHPAACQSSTGATCNGNSCTYPPQPDGTFCSNGLCTTGASCQGGACTGGTQVVCTAADSCHDAGTCNPATGLCSDPAKANGTACNDGNACTLGETCQNGTCGSPTSTVTCTAQDQCHLAGTCDPSTGACSNPTQPNGTACNDNSLCTSGDNCQNGTCTGTAVVCTAQDQCHNAGTCDPTTGVCSNPAKPNGTACNDNNACTSGDSCQNGTCTGTAVVCTASDSCHNAGTCDPTTGACSNPAKPNGTTCNDNNACTSGETCQSGVCGNPTSTVTCTAQDQCHLVGTCDPTTGVCSNPINANGTACNDNNACTTGDSCQNGTCTGTAVVCTAQDQCHLAGTCDSTTGVCSNPTKANGTACNDNNACTSGDSCQNGTCTGTATVCSASDQCHNAGTCDPTTGVCSNPIKTNGTACNDNNACTTGETCQNGACGSPTSTVTCTAQDQCHLAGTCDSTTGVCSNPIKTNGTACNDNNACTTGDSCQNGTCAGTDVVCAAQDQCHNAGTCDPTTGVCSNPIKSNGTACNDNNACTSGDNCQNGTCTGTATVCTASDQCHNAGTCDPTTGVCSNPIKSNGTTCNDGNTCTSGETCQNGNCGSPTSTVTCTAQDQCHLAGSCDPTTGACSNPTKTNGTSCNDLNACTTGDSCQNGTCTGAAVACTAQDQCHNAGTCDSTTGVCSNPIKANGSACNDGNACTTGDSCQNGTCAGSAVTCTAQDQCHNAGTCDSTTGVCSNPIKANGSACNDNNACTSGDSCQNGTCTGNALTCTASDQCHVAGTCDPTTGACSNPNKANGSACNDGNACTTADTCQNGTCTGTAVTCAAPDQCHNPGTCDSTSGQCVYPNKANGTACDDGNACTSNDVCQNGVCQGSGVTCAPPDQCHNPGVCDPSTLTCSYTAKANGTACSDGNACTTGDTCQSGTCIAGTPVTCAPPDQCHDAGACDSATGQCVYPNKANGTACNDNSACTSGDNCQAGVCTGTAITCAPPDQCHQAGMCDPATGQCSFAAKTDGTACNDGNGCTSGDSCQAGVCTGTALTCLAMDACHAPGTCDSATGLCSNPTRPDGTACNDNNACTSGDHCQAGVCTGTGMTCTALDQCHVAGTCNPTTGTCSNPITPNGTACDDGNACTSGDTCQSGGCSGGAPTVCTALDACHVAGVCDPQSGGCSNPPIANGSICNDGNPCTTADSCRAGVCTGGPPITCTPLDQCHDAGVCDPASGQCSTPAKADGTACDDGDACTTADSCQAGICTGMTPVVCGALDQCHVAGTCNTVTGLCSNPPIADGTACDDGNPCTQSDACTAGACAGRPMVCTGETACTTSTCDPATGQCSPTVPKATGTHCDDGNACTTGDVCANGICQGSPIVCNTPPDPQCADLNGTCGASGCVYLPHVGAACDDGDPETTMDTCGTDGLCHGMPSSGPPPDSTPPSPVGMTAAGCACNIVSHEPAWPASLLALAFALRRRRRK